MDLHTATITHSSAVNGFSLYEGDTHFRVKVTKNGFSEYTSVYTVVRLEEEDSTIAQRNYVKTTTPLVATSDISSLTFDQLLTQYVYVDGMGRNIQSVAKGVTPAGSDVVSFTEYDHLGRAPRSYLPYIATGQDFYSSNVADQLDFYTNNRPAGITNGADPFSDVVYDDRGRVVQQGAPGTSWQVGSGHEVEMSYEFNGSNEVIQWAADGTSSAYYAPNTLIKNTTTDENGHRVRTFTDVRGNQILKQVEDNSNEWLSTYHLYDHAGRLTYSLPPKAVELLGSGASHDISTIASLADLIYHNQYDEEGKLIMRKIPGKGEEYIVYDAIDRPVLTQDAQLLSKGQWAFVKHDRIGRTVMSGLYNSSGSRTDLQGDLDGEPDLYEAYNGAGETQYSNYAFPALGSNTTVLTVNFYDTYDFRSSWDAAFAFSNPDLSLPLAAKALATGSATGGMVKTDAGWNRAVNYFDGNHLPIQSVSSNHLGGYDRSTMYREDHTNRLTKQTLEHSDSTEQVEVTNRLTYDRVGRVQTATHQIDAQPERTIAAYRYNELGQLLEKNLDGATEAAALQSIDYTYLLRGWLAGINDAALSEADGDLFGMQLSYDEVLSGLGNAAQYNGNISAIRWSGYETDQEDFEEHGYRYVYTDSDRLTKAVHGKKGDSWNVDNAFRLKDLQYDANGNIQALTRNNASGGVADQLTYSYSANQLTQVLDNGDSIGFVDGHTGSDDYFYDANGNLIKDLNKGIESIRYNHLDLPLTIILSDDEAAPADSLTYQYTGTGTKLQMKVWADGSIQSQVDYVGGMRYENGVLHSMAHAEGRILMYEGSNGGQEEPVTELTEVFTSDFASMPIESTTIDMAFSANAGAATVGGGMLLLEDGSPADANRGSVNFTFDTEVSKAYQIGFVIKGKGTLDPDPDALELVTTVNGTVMDIHSQISTDRTVSLPFVATGSTTTINFSNHLNDAIWSGSPGSEPSITYELDDISLYEETVVSDPAPQPGTHDYQFFLRDHQGNTRRVLSTKHEQFLTVEDFEDHESDFTDLRRHTYSAANATVPKAENDGVSLLQSGQTGAMIMLRMDKGDTVDLSVKAKYEGPLPGNTMANLAYDVLFASWNNAFGSGIEGANASQISDEFEEALMNGMGSKGDPNTAPRAFLNYIFFDLDMNFSKAGFQQISTAANNPQHETISLNGIIAEQSGYILAYLSNENSEAVNVYFDDLTVRQGKMNVVQAVDYYPFGMEAMTYTRTAADPTEYLYNGGVEKNDLTGYYETFYRSYDPSIGRFHQVDIAAVKYSSLSPYQYAFNDPVYWNDPLGDDPWWYFGDNGASQPMTTAQQWMYMGDAHLSRRNTIVNYGMMGGNSYSFGAISTYTGHAGFIVGAAYNDFHNSWEHTQYGSYNASADAYNAAIGFNLFLHEQSVESGRGGVPCGGCNNSSSNNDRIRELQNSRNPMDRALARAILDGNTNLLNNFQNKTIHYSYGEELAYRREQTFGNIVESIWHSRIARHVIPDVMTIELSAGSSFAVGNMKGITLNIITRGVDAGLHLTDVESFFNQQGNYRYGIDIDAGINFGVLNYERDSRNLQFSELLGDSYLSTAGFVLEGTVTRSFDSDGNLLFSGFSSGIGATLGASFTKATTTKHD